MPKNEMLVAHGLKKQAIKDFNSAVNLHEIHVKASKERSVESYVAYRTAAELANARSLLLKSLIWSKGRKANTKERAFIELLLKKVREYPERARPAEEILFTPEELAAAKRFGKSNLLRMGANLSKIDSIISRHINVRGVTVGGNNFPNHFLWQGLSHANRLLIAIISKIK